VGQGPADEQAVAAHVLLEAAHLAAHAEPGARGEDRDDAEEEGDDQLVGELHEREL
jgi:hypothetical protein